jgi:hypothetical protein
MTMDTLNALLDASIRGTLMVITASFWIFGLVAIWKWFFRVMKRLIQLLFPNLVKKKSDR